MPPPRRFKADDEFTVSGIDLRISQGSKFPGDLRLDIRANGRWVPVKMELGFFLVDFFTENERARQPHVSWWVRNGDTYYLDKCLEAVRSGWRSVSAEIERQRAARV